MNCNLQTGVSAALAQQRAACIDDITYRLRFSVPLDAEYPVHGIVLLSFNLKERRNVVLDYCGMSEGSEIKVSINGENCLLTVEKEHLVISAERLRVGKNEVLIPFVSSEEAVHRGENYVYTLFVPDKARYAFPCFDQPDMRAHFIAEIEAPEGWTVVTNDTKHTIPTYLFAFAAGRFVATTYSGITAYHLPESTVDFAELLSQMHFAQRWMERYTGITLPWEKNEAVILPEMRFTGMEHPGCIFFRETGANNTRPERRRFNTTVHETAHLWVGDLATMSWFGHVWAKEGLANFLADKMAAEYFGAEFDMEQRRREHLGFLVDVEGQVERRLDNMADAMKMYGPLSYHRAPLLLHDLEEQIGKEKMREAIRTLLHRFSYSNYTLSQYKEIFKL